jgi:flagellar biosynthesis/type III secretory pathway chaperone
MKSKKDLITTLEDTLVKQFRNLQTLITTTQDERKALTNADLKALMKIVENKEDILDNLELIEESRRMTTEQLCNMEGLPEGNWSISALFKTLDPTVATRLSNLQDGIIKLVDEARNINMGNNAIAKARTDAIHATQAFLLSFYQSPVSYQPVGVPQARSMLISDLDHRV